jgi:hypothetical protein
MDLRLLVQTYCCILVTALFLSAMGLAVSTVMRRSVPALLLAYRLGAPDGVRPPGDGVPVPDLPDVAYASQGLALPGAL